MAWEASGGGEGGSALGDTGSLRVRIDIEGRDSVCAPQQIAYSARPSV
jgi:hypothetical protein